MFVLRNNPVGVKYLVKRFGGTHFRISNNCWAWFPAEGTTLKLVGTKTFADVREEQWEIDGDFLVIDRWNDGVDLIFEDEERT